MIMTIIIPRGSDCKNDHHDYNAMKIIIFPHLRLYNRAETDDNDNYHSSYVVLITIIIIINLMIIITIMQSKL